MSNRRRVEKVSAISAISATSTVEIGHTTSITSDPDNRWIAHRQSAITAALERRHVDHGREFAESVIERNNDKTHTPPKQLDPANGKSPLRFSGESNRIGEGNWNEKTAFGKHVGYL